MEFNPANDILFSAKRAYLRLWTQNPDHVPSFQYLQIYYRLPIAIFDFSIDFQILKVFSIIDWLDFQHTLIR